MIPTEMACVIGLVLPTVAALARVERPVWLMTLGLLLLMVVQATLAGAGPPGVRALHPVAGLLILGLAAHLVLRSYQSPTVPLARRANDAAQPDSQQAAQTHDTGI